MTGLDWLAQSSESPSVADAARPLALGYVRESSEMSDAELAHAKRVLAEFAASEGYALSTVYVERVERTPAAFEALIATAIRDEAAAVIVPGASHLALIGSATEMTARVAQTTGARVLEVHPAGPSSP
jgi:hypothetical protein